MRFDDIEQTKIYESKLSLNDEDWYLIVTRRLEVL